MMISIQNFRRKCFLPVIVFLMGALFLITTKRAPYLNQNINLLLSRGLNDPVSSPFDPQTIPKLKSDLYEKAISDEKRHTNIFIEKNKESSNSDPGTPQSTTKIANEENNNAIDSIQLSKDEKLNILFWNGFWNWPFFGMGVGNRGFVSNKCKYQNCYTTNQRKKITNSHTRIDAIVTHGFDEDLARLASTNSFRTTLMEKNQGYYPLFVYFFKEPPSTDQDVRYKEHENFSNLFNITYTYRRDSVIPFTYGKVIPKDYENSDLHTILQDSSPVKWKPVPQTLPRSVDDRDFSYKKKGILWMVSHCETDSRREDYVKKLQSHLSTLSIDIMGKCGNDTLPKSNIDGRKLDQQIHDREKMYKELLKPYKFYLSFENANCFDYISEKFFTALKTEEVIPIALGGASTNEYTTSAPPRSYIHVNEYPTVELLATKLEYLSQNQTAYKEFFWWTEHYQVSSLWDHYVSAQCDLCEKMNLSHRKRLKLEPTNLYEFLSSEKTCHYNTSQFL